jgi:chromosome segregation ATPase
MESPRLASQLEYLEKKLQEANATIARLQQRVEGQEYTAQQQAHRLQQVEQELSQTATQLAQATLVDDKLAHLKDELLHLIERRTGPNRGTLPEAGGSTIVTAQLENQTRAINEMRREVEKTHRFEEQLALARTESTRLGQDISKFQLQLDTLSRKLEERTNPIALFEEQRRNDARKLAELQAEIPGLHKKIESNLAKVQIVSQQIPQFAKYEAALDSIRGEIRNYREHMDFQLAQRERQLKDWTGVAAAMEKRIKEIESSMEKYTEYYQLNKRALASLQDFQEQLQRDQHHFGELQRLTEERQRAATEKFQAEFEQRWQKQTMEFQPQLADFQKGVTALQQRIADVAKHNATVEKQLNMVLLIIEEDIQARAAAATDWQHRFEELAEGQA